MHRALLRLGLGLELVRYCVVGVITRERSCCLALASSWCARAEASAARASAWCSLACTWGRVRVRVRARVRG